MQQNTGTVSELESGLSVEPGNVLLSNSIIQSKLQPKPVESKLGAGSPE